MRDPSYCHTCTLKALFHYYVYIFCACHYVCHPCSPRLQGDDGFCIRNVSARVRVRILGFTFWINGETGGAKKYISGQKEVFSILSLFFSSV